MLRLVPPAQQTGTSIQMCLGPWAAFTNSPNMCEPGSTLCAASIMRPFVQPCVVKGYFTFWSSQCAVLKRMLVGSRKQYR